MPGVGLLAGFLPVELRAFEGRRILRIGHELRVPSHPLELGETTAAGALRETDEEAGARIELEGLYTVMNVVRVGQVHFYYRARLCDTRFDPGPETIEARLFREEEVPWEQLAFRTVRETLERYFADRRRGSFGLHCVDL